MQRAHGLVELQLHNGGGARRYALAPAYRDAGGNIRRCQMQVHGRPVLEWLRFAGQHRDTPGNALRRLVYLGCEHPITTAHRVKVGAGEIHRAALPGHGLLRGLAVHLNAAHAHFVARGRDHQFIAGGHLAVEHGAGDDRATARHRKRTVDGIAKVLCGAGAGCSSSGLALEVFAQLVDARATDGGHRHHRHIRQ